MSDKSPVAIVIDAEPLNDCPAIFLAVARVVAVSALPVRAPTKSVDVIGHHLAIYTY